MKTKSSGDSPNRQIYSLTNILGKTQKFLNDKIFKIDLKKRINEGDPNFDFFHLKIKKISSNGEDQTASVVIQIIDMSDKMLYNEVKAE